MNPSFRHMFPVLLIGSLFVVVPLEGAGPTELMPFEIKDQFDRVHTDADLRDNVVFVLGSDKEGSQYNSRWVNAIEELIAQSGSRDKIVLVEIADLRGVPFFVRGFVKKKFPRDEEYRVLLDWKGRFATHYGFQPGTCSILLFGRRGNLVHQVSVEDADAERLSGLRNALDALAVPAIGSTAR